MRTDLRVIPASEDKITDITFTREAPAPLLVAPATDASDQSYPDALSEPVLDVDQIQGNILAGFSKDHQTLLFLKITDATTCKQWLKTIIPFIATLEEVLAFNRLFKRIRSRRGECLTVQATWVNIAFSYQGLSQLTPDAASFTDQAFKSGLAINASDLGDPVNTSDEGNPANWVVGGPNNEADILVIVAGDDENDLHAEVARIEDSIFAPRTSRGTMTHSGVQVIYKQHGDTLPAPLTGHEHFGFLDGISQPGIRGRLSDNPRDVLAPRQNPNNRDQGKPGQDLLWPGEFVFGYPGQNAQGPVPEAGVIADAGVSWAKNGSFLVFRRLRQDVLAFNTFVQQAATGLGVDSTLLGAKLVGRWKSGAPVLRAPQADNQAVGNDDCANNNYEFQGATEPLPDTSSGTLDCTDIISESTPPAHFGPSPGDTTGQICPIAAHTRKAYPRDDVRSSTNTPYQTASPFPLSEANTQTHRLLRRGAPFGKPLLDAAADSGDRGLLFLAYQTSIERQFEFVTKNWLNSPDFKDPGVGHDPILGQNNQDPSRARSFTFLAADGSPHAIELPHDFVIPTGGGYFFAPSIHALESTVTI